MNNSCTEFEFIHRIVEEISISKLRLMPLLIAKCPVGMNSRVKAIKSLLDIESDDVRMIGIYSLGGVGKTTIVKALYNKIFNHFEVRIFLKNVREMSETNDGVIHLQENFLFEILGDNNLKVSNVSKGTNMINENLFQKRVRIILDDVDKLDQTKKLLGKCDLFASRSRIVITIRDKHLLAPFGKGYSTCESLELFSMYAF